MDDSAERYPVPKLVAMRLQELILSGELAENSRLPSERLLAQRLQVSRPSIREALKNLESLGLVRVLPARGTFVRKPGSASATGKPGWRFSPATPLEHVFELRGLIEPRIARNVASVPGGIDTQRLTFLTDLMEKTWQDGDLVAHAEADLEFHDFIARLCPNKLLVQTYEHFRHIVTETHRTLIPLTLSKPTADDIIKQACGQHRAIIDALQNLNPDEAEKAMAEHVDFAMRSGGIRP